MKFFNKDKKCEMAQKGIVLVVEDSQGDQKFIASVLGKHGYQVLMAENGKVSTGRQTHHPASARRIP